MSLQIIRTELETRLTNWANSFTPPIQVALEGVPFNKPNEDASLPKNPFVEAFILPGVTINPSVAGNDKREIGIFQVNVWCPDGRGTGQITAIAESLVSAFPVIPKMGYVSIERTPSTAQSMPENDWRVIPVSINYRLDSGTNNL